MAPAEYAAALAPLAETERVVWTPQLDEARWVVMNGFWGLAGCQPSGTVHAWAAKRGACNAPS
jgi:hypothetical protein